MITFPNHIQDAFDELRNRGFAVVVFTPGELQGVDSEVVEDEMVAAGWQTIFICKDSNMEEFDWENHIEEYPTGE